MRDDGDAPELPGRPYAGYDGPLGFADVGGGYPIEPDPVDYAPPPAAVDPGGPLSVDPDAADYDLWTQQDDPATETAQMATETADAGQGTGGWHDQDDGAEDQGETVVIPPTPVNSWRSWDVQQAPVATPYYGEPETRDWRPYAVVGGAVALILGVAAASIPWGGSEQAAIATPTPTLTYESVREDPDDGHASPAPIFTPFSPTASPSPSTSPTLTPSRTRDSGRGEGRQDAEDDGRLAVDPDRPASTRDDDQGGQRDSGGSGTENKPKPKKTTTGTGGNGGTSTSLVGQKCDELFPPSKPEFALRNRACHQMYG
ncbi:hypothetical protein [Nonomuraea typhae]|uniref:hypothetical protein n=1 Tax=Nonomuraea typhae TaxID=2603600 RepID=UPI0012FC74F9|nr:hypothetical protein [Nonomuraea typhae]